MKVSKFSDRGRGLFKRGVLGTGLKGETRFDVVRPVFREASASMTMSLRGEPLFLSLN